MQETILEAPFCIMRTCVAVHGQYDVYKNIETQEK